MNQIIIPSYGPGSHELNTEVHGNRFTGSKNFFFVLYPANSWEAMYCLHVVRPTDCVSVTFCFLNILKYHKIYKYVQGK